MVSKSVQNTQSIKCISEALWRLLQRPQHPQEVIQSCPRYLFDKIFDIYYWFVQGFEICVEPDSCINQLNCVKFWSFFGLIVFKFIAWFSCLGCSNFYFRNLFFKPKIRHSNLANLVKEIYSSYSTRKNRKI